MTTAMTATPVTVSASAAERIGAILAGEPAGTYFRISVEGGGCSGFQYKFGFDSLPAEDDIVVKREKAAVLIDSVSLQFISGAEIDFVDELIGQSFKIHNPNATSSCGCGTSFTL